MLENLISPVRIPSKRQRSLAAGLALCALFITSCGESKSKKELENRKRELEKVEIETAELSRTSTERRVKVQAKDQSRTFSIASQPDGMECEGSEWDGKKGKCWTDSYDSQSGESNFWTLIIRKDVQVKIGFLLTGCQKGLLNGSCESETVYRTIDIKGP